MLALVGLTILLGFQLLGEVLAAALQLPLPGAVLGMALLALGLLWRPLREPVRACAELLLANLSLLFVPAGVGVMVHMGLVVQHGWSLLGILLLSTAIGLVVTAVVLRWLMRHEPGAQADNPQAGLALAAQAGGQASSQAGGRAGETRQPGEGE